MSARLALVADGAGKIANDSAVIVARSPIGIVVRTGAINPDVGTRPLLPRGA
jgi:hypothetical protein